jgi:hypothetical protein
MIAYFCYGLLCLFIISVLSTLCILIYEHYRVRYVYKKDDVVYYYEREEMIENNHKTILSSSKDGHIMIVDDDILNRDFKRVR